MALTDGMSALAQSIFNIESGNQNPSSLAVTLNNPGNLVYVGQEGAVPSSHAVGGGLYLAQFPDWSTGVAALESQLQLYAQRGLSLLGLFQIYAPASDPRNNPTAYAQSVADQLGVGVNDSVASVLYTNPPSSVSGATGAAASTAADASTSTTDSSGAVTSNGGIDPVVLGIGAAVLTVIAYAVSR